MLSMRSATNRRAASAVQLRRSHQLVDCHALSSRARQNVRLPQHRVCQQAAPPAADAGSANVCVHRQRVRATMTRSASTGTASKLTTALRRRDAMVQQQLLAGPRAGGGFSAEHGARRAATQCLTTSALPGAQPLCSDLAAHASAASAGASRSCFKAPRAGSSIFDHVLTQALLRPCCPAATPAIVDAVHALHPSALSTPRLTPSPHAPRPLRAAAASRAPTRRTHLHSHHASASFYPSPVASPQCARKRDCRNRRNGLLVSPSSWRRPPASARRWRR